MCTSRVASIFAALLIPAVALSEPPSPIVHPFETRLNHVRFVLSIDGSYVEEREVVERVAQPFGVSLAQHYPFGARSVFESAEDVKLEILESYTEKPDGSHIVAKVLDSDAVAGKVSRTSVGLIAFPQAQVGDSLHVSFRVRHGNPLLRGRFDIHEGYWRNAPRIDRRVEIRAPLSLHVQVRDAQLAREADSTEGKEQVWVLRSGTPPSGSQDASPMASIDITSDAVPGQGVAANAFPRTPATPMQPPAAGPAPAWDGGVADDSGTNDPQVHTLTKSPSAWRESEKSFYRQLLAGRSDDVLVVPCQVQRYAFDRPTRSLMTAELAAAIGQAGHFHLADPYLVARALGDGVRRFDAAEVYQLAAQMDVRQVLWCYVGHDRHHHLFVTVTQETRVGKTPISSSTPMRTAYAKTRDFTDEHPALESYESVLPELLPAIGFNFKAPSRSAQGLEPADLELPERLEQLATRSDRAARDALVFQLLAYLTPAGADRARERFAEKSYLALQGLSPGSGDYASLKARAYLLLGQRPAALEALGKAATPMAAELHAMLQGDQPSVRALSQQLRGDVPRLIGALDANLLATAYGGQDVAASSQAADALSFAGELWPRVVGRAFNDVDDWSQFDNATWKKLLDREFPVSNEDFESQVRGMVSLGDTDQIRNWVALSVYNHARKWREVHAENSCCDAKSVRPAPSDLVELLEAVGEDNLLRHARFLVRPQGNYQGALDELARIEIAYRGHPRLVLTRGLAKIGLAGSKEAADRKVLLKDAYGDLLDAITWEQGQTRVANDAQEATLRVRALGYTINDFSEDPFVGDSPFRSFYKIWQLSNQPDSQLENAQAALAASTYETKPLELLAQSFALGIGGGTASRDDLFRRIDGRFIGSPTVYLLRADASLGQGDFDRTAQLLRDCIRVQPDAWNAYSRLGALLMRQGRATEAGEAYGQFPGFDPKSTASAVGVSNYAVEAANAFYRAGEIALARRFYEIATRRPTDSAADLLGRARLHVMDGRLAEAADDYRECGRHYADAGCYAQQMQLAFVLSAGHPDWDAFRELVKRFDDSSAWEIARVGFAIEGKSDADILAWADQQAGRKAGARNNRLAIGLLRAGMLDRSVSPELSKAVGKVALPVWKDAQSFGSYVQPPFSDGPRNIVGPRMRNGSPPDAGRVYARSQLQFFVDGVRALQDGHDEQAWSVLHEAAQIYDLADKGYGAAELVPYYALAAVRRGKVAEVADFLDGLKPAERGFESELARAVLSDAAGRTDESVQHLELARAVRPYSNGRLLPAEFEFAQVCEWLFERSGQPRYRGIALDWARRMQKLEPFESWPYALEALLAQDSPERVRAIALASFLDPRSAWLARIPATQRQDAVKSYKGLNPFEPPPARAGDST